VRAKHLLCLGIREDRVHSKMIPKGNLRCLATWLMANFAEAAAKTAAAGMTKRVWEISDVVDVLEAWEALPQARL
jgi:hypothetical protein